ncbi:hypothetical protein ABFS82_08G130800 [Erythranthe guttata]|uniref:Uncharacterized protein n=1 Tax=Erythranthe guttata TaxID=4155 RepID=A0A022RT84_ERYGU|nr:hypothetical protein MIMGU_mgv1a020303mg [Erythranthe guttata]
MEKKQSSAFSFLFKRLSNKKSSGDGGGGGGGGAWRWRRKSSRSDGFRWKKKFNLYHWIVDSLLFRIVSVLEAVVLVSRLCFFFLCCGCHF